MTLIAVFPVESVIKGTQMKTRIKESFVVPVLTAALGSVLAGHVAAQTLTVLHSFTSSSQSAPGSLYTNADGIGPVCGLVLSGGILYGAASIGGSSGLGTVFALSPNGAGFTTLYTFTGGGDESYPWSLVSSGDTLYGTARSFSIGPGLYGTVFKVGTNGTGFTTPV
jgi:uncharacterized repeat protein (TIGR03803 family)